MESDLYHVKRNHISLFFRILDDINEKYNIPDDRNVHSVPELLQINNNFLSKEIGLEYEHTLSGSSGAFKIESAYAFKIINKKKFVLAKIKYGI